MKLLNIEDLVKDTKALTFKRADKYLDTYKRYINYFKNKDQLTPEDVITGIAFVYSWMPRVLSINTEKIPEFIRLVDVYKTSAEKSNGEKLVLAAQECCEGSLVGASKLLHFIFPDSFPIYDSHVYRYCFPENKAYHHHVSKLENYIQYRDAVLSIAELPKAKKIQQKISKELKYEVSVIRAIEMCIFFASKAEADKQGKVNVESLAHG